MRRRLTRCTSMRLNPPCGNHLQGRNLWDLQRRTVILYSESSCLHCTSVLYWTMFPHQYKMCPTAVLQCLTYIYVLVYVSLYFIGQCTTRKCKRCVLKSSSMYSATHMSASNLYAGIVQYHVLPHCSYCVIY